MKVQKVTVSIFLKDEKVIRISLDKIFLLIIFLLIITPYGILTFKMLRHTSNIATIASNNEFSNSTSQPIAEQKIVEKITESPKQIKPELVPVNKPVEKTESPKEESAIVTSAVPVEKASKVASSNASTNPYLITNLQMYAIGRDLSVDFVLTKKKIDNKMSAGSVYVEVIDKNQNAVVVSGKAPYKFSMARPSKFFLNVPIQYKADKIKIHITDAYSDVQNKVYEYAIPSSTEL